MGYAVYYHYFNSPLFSACKTGKMKQENISVYAFHLKPGEDLKKGIEKVTREKGIEAGGWPPARAVPAI